MHKGLITFFLVLISAQHLPAQKTRGVTGIGLSAGASNYTGDLDDDFTLPFTRLGLGAHAIFQIRKQFFLKTTFFHGRITASDAEAVNFTGNQFRNLSFYTDIDELGLQLVYSLQNRKRGFTKRNFVTPYVFAGLAIYHFNPKKSLNGEVYELQKIGTEGQYLDGDYPEPYSLTQIAIPAGVGFSLKLSPGFDIGAETGFRKTFTDYLDDVSGVYPDKELLLEKQGPLAVYLSDPSNDPSRPNGFDSFSQRGNPKFKDWYVYTHLHLTFYFTDALFKQTFQKSRFRKNSCKGL